MQPRHDRNAVYLVRQPIMESSDRVFGYELLYRDGANAGPTESTEHSDQATARLLTDAILSIGLDTLTSRRPAFVSFTRHLLVTNAATLLPAESVVIGVAPELGGDLEVTAACQRMHSDGYTLALDDFPEGGAEALLSYVKFVKVDLLTTPSHEVAALVKRLGARVRVMAKRVETEDLYTMAKAAGCHLFQGFYFCAPVMRQTKALPARQLAYLNLFTALNRPNLAIGDLEDCVKRDVSLTFRVLRSVNSAAFGGGREITSVRQALVLLGIDQIRKWASVWSLAGLNGGTTSETMSLALIRARCCELIGTRLSGPDVGAEMFLLGLCSLLDVILSQPMEMAIADMQLSAMVRAALLGEQNTGRSVLDAVIAYERADWDRATDVSTGVGLAESELPEAYADSLAWARELAQAAA